MRLAITTNLPSLAEFYARHDLQIGAGGGATWERCCIGVPTLAMVTADNQTASLLPLADMGILDVFDAREGANELGGALEKLIGGAERRHRYAECSRRLVDGKGALRVGIALLRDTMTIRIADADDARMMFEWRGATETRLVSREAGKLVWSEHLAWLERVLADPDRQLMVAQIGGRPVGVIRFDGTSRAEVSLYLDPSLHGLGLGRELLLKGEEASGIDTIDATVLEGNEASSRLFERCGYRRTSPGTWTKHR